VASPPAKSNSRGIQRRHTRRIKTTEGYRDVLINPSVKKINIAKPVTLVPAKSPGKAADPRKAQPPSLPPTTRKLPVKLRWQDTGLKPDDGTAKPISSPKLYTFEQAWQDIDGMWPNKNEEDFEEEYINEPLTELNTKIANGELNKKEADEAYQEILDEATSILEGDESEPSATIIYGQEMTEGEYDPERGFISTYHKDNAKGIDVKWHRSSAWRGYNDVILPPDSPWEILHEDNILSMSQDEQNLHTFHELLEAALKERDINYATVYTTSSNVFSQGYTFLVEKGRADEVKRIVDELKKVYRRDEDYQAEANPLYQGVKDAKAAGSTAEQLRQLLSKTDDEEVRATLKKAIDKVFK
jgi:polyhydroxyalkanoate synthesis regulator phasin